MFWLKEKKNEAKNTFKQMMTKSLPFQARSTNVKKGLHVLRLR